MKIGKKLQWSFLVLLTVALIGALVLPAQTRAATEDALTFALNADGESYCVTGSEATIQGELVIPATYNGKPVTAIGANAFYMYGDLSCVTLPKSVTSIGDNAFGDGWNINYVHYTGTEEDRNNITIGTGNNDFWPAHSATWHYEVEPVVYEGMQCHYCETCDYYFRPNGKQPQFTITYKDWDGTVLFTSKAYFGGNISVPADPYRGPDEKGYIYIFDQWSPELSCCLGDTTYTAQYSRHENVGCLYSIENGKVTIIGYHGDSQIMRIPDTIEGYPVTSIAAYAFEYRTDIKTVFMPASITSIGSYAFIYGCRPVVFYEGTQEQWDAVQKGSMNTYYGPHIGFNETTFGDQSCYYCSHCDEYLLEDGTRAPAYVYFYDWDGTFLKKSPVYYKEDRSTMYGHLDSPNPTREMDDVYRYTFSGWDKQIDEICTGNMYLTAQYQAMYRQYKIVFQDYDGKALPGSSNYYVWGSEPDAAEAVKFVSKPSDNIYNYRFVGWDKEVVPCAGDAVYTAVYEPEYINYTVRFWAEEQLICEQTYHWGDSMTPPSDPTKQPSGSYAYTFVGWQRRMTNDCETVWVCDGEIDYYAVFSYELRRHNAVWQDWDGTVLHQDTFLAGSMPDSTPPDPTREPDQEYTYTFTGWEYTDDENGDRIYLARYSRELRWYLVRFVDWDGRLMAEQNCYWGDELYPPVPYRAPENGIAYTFIGWDKEIVPCAGDATYVARYSESEYIPEVTMHTVTFLNDDGTVISSGNYGEGDPIPFPDNPVKAADNTYTYTFANWAKTEDLNGNITYTATYTATYIEYKITFLDWDGRVLKEQSRHWGARVAAPEKVTRKSDVTYTYTFAGWDKPVASVCKGNATYTATYTASYIEYRVTFKDADGKIISQMKYHYNDTVVLPTAPVKESDEPYAYTWNFAGWTPEVSTCTGNTTHTATYAQEYIKYTVIFQNWDGSELSRSICRWGEPVTPPAEPTRESDETNNYYFVGWDKAVVNCAGDATYRAEFTTKHTHVYKEVVVPPKCTEQGYTAYVCICGESYHDTFVEPLGHNYQFTVIKPTYTQAGYTDCICACGGTERKDFKKPLGLPAPSVKLDANLKLYWDATEEATGYEIYRATSKSGKYTKVAIIEKTDWLDPSTSIGKTYYYRVKAVYELDPSCNSGYSNTISVVYKCAAPQIAVQNDPKGKPYITWEKTSGAKKYTVYRATSETGKYKSLGTTTKTCYTDSKAAAGNTYYYKVIANASSSKYNSGYSNIVSCGVICGTPSVTVKIDTNTGKPSLSWKKIDGAAKYAIYRDGELLTTVTAVTYADTTAAIDTRYSYAVQALGKTESLNSAISEAVTATSGIAKPAANGSVDTVSGKPVITWQAVEGAVKYEIYRSTSSSKSYKLVATVEELTYTDETVSAGKTYYYKVKAIGAVSKSADSNYVKLTGKCATPVISVSNDAKGKPYITWDKISGAKKYTVYRATSETGKYTKLGTTTKAYYTDSKASAGKTYFYKIVANASSSKNNSPYSNIVSCGVNCATPVVKVTNNASGKPVLSWSKVSGAVKYEIYLLGAEDYVVLGTVTGTTWTDAGCATGEGRYYGVRAIAAEEAYNSEVSETVFGRGTCATPKATGKVGENKKPVITWAEVDGATKYVVYRSTSKSKGYKIIGESETLTYEDLTAAKGKTYYYKVVAVGENCESAQSSYAKVKSK